MSEKRPSQYPKRYRPRIARTAEHDWLNDAKDRSIKTWDRLSALPACHTENDRLGAYPTTKTPGLALLAMNSAAIAKTYFEHGQFVRFMQLPLNFRLITTGPSCNTLAAPLFDWAINPLNDVHQGRVIFFDSANCGRCAKCIRKVGYLYAGHKLRRFYDSVSKKSPTYNRKKQH